MGSVVSEVYAAQPREGTETVYDKIVDHNYKGETGLCSSTPRGDGNTPCAHVSRTISRWFMQLNPARGRKLASITVMVPLCADGFMQLNPARGRKHEKDIRSIRADEVYAAQPREGTETVSTILHCR